MKGLMEFAASLGPRPGDTPEQVAARIDRAWDMVRQAEQEREQAELANRVKAAGRNHMSLLSLRDADPELYRDYANECDILHDRQVLAAYDAGDALRLGKLLFDALDAMYEEMEAQAEKDEDEQDHYRSDERMDDRDRARDMRGA